MANTGTDIWSNLNDRWNNNPGEDPFEKAQYRAWDRQGDRFMRAAERTGNRAKIFNELAERDGPLSGLWSNLAENATNRSAKLGWEAVDRSTRYPGYREDKFRDETAEDLKDNRDVGRYMPYDQEGSAYDKWGKSIDTQTPIDKAQLELNPFATDVFSNYDTTGKQIGGKSVNEWEAGALGNLANAGSRSDSMTMGGDVMQFTKQLQGFTPIVMNGQVVGYRQPDTNSFEGALFDSMTRAQKGELTAPDSQYYQAFKKNLDETREDELRNLSMEYGKTRNFGSGRHMLALQDLSENIAAKQYGALTDLQKTYADKGSALYNTLVGTASDLVKSGRANETQANQIVNNTVLQNAQLEMQNQENKLKEQLSAIDNLFKNKELEMKQSGQYADKAKWENEYDIAQRENFGSMLENFWSALFPNSSTKPGLNALTTLFTTK